MKITKQTKAAISGLEWAVQELAGKPQQPDEFSCNEFHAATLASGYQRSRESCHCQLQRMAKNGQLLSRKSLVKGALANLYRKP